MTRSTSLTDVGDDFIGEQTSKIAGRDVTRRFPAKGHEIAALGPFDLDIAENEFVCLVGPSGCGKSTFLRIVGGLLTPSRGALTIRASGTHLTDISMVFQDYGIFPWKTVQQNITIALESKHIQRAKARERARWWLHRMGLESFSSAYPSTLSGGMRQRVAIARALALDPEILLLDEPFAALDAQMRLVMQDELLALCQEGNRTVLFVTHSLDEAITLGDRVVVMTARPGTLLDDKSVPFRRPRAPQIRNSAEFSNLRAELWSHLSSQVYHPSNEPSVETTQGSND